MSFGDDPEIFFTDTDTDEILRIWRLVPHPAYNATAVYIRGGSVWIDAVGSIGIGGFELTTVTASENTRLTYGHYGGSAFALPILYDHGQNSAHAVELIDIFGSIFWGNQTNLTFPKPLALLTTVNERLVALFTDESAATYDFDGTTLTHRSDLPGTYNLLAPIEGDAFLSVQGGVWQRWDASSAAATLTSITAGTFPTPGSPGNAASVSNIVFTDKEPFVDPTAEPIFIGKVRDWTTAATRIDRDWDVTALSQNAAGLGSPVSLPVDTDSPNSHFALVSQYAENISFRLLEPTAYGKPVSDITISPPSGTYPPPSGTPPIGLSITFSTSGAAGTPVILFRLAGSTVWQTYNPTHPPEIFTTTTIEAHAISAEGRTPTRRATYVFADPSALTPGSFIDADGDGLPDQWEDAFNAYDPLGDADGDGISNLTEYHDCTDPQDAHSSGAHPLVLEYEHLGGSLRLEWSIARPTAVLEGSDDLVTWSPITTGITTVAGKFRLDIPIGADPRGFFRLKQN